jgi:antitoxin component YwqK of YwqJK toxin-antitoxin module
VIFKQKKLFIMKYSLVFCLVFCLIACKKDIETVHNTDSDGTKTEYALRVKDSVQHGAYKKFYPSGECFEASTFKDGKLDGVRTIFYKNGTHKTIENYKNGNYEGAIQEFYENGVLKQIGNYTNNVLNGELKNFYPNGNIKEIVAMADNDENGPFKEFYENGVLKTEGTYKDGGKEQGELKMYDASGQLVKIMTCDYGRCYTKWKTAGYVDEEVEE